MSHMLSSPFHQQKKKKKNSADFTNQRSFRPNSTQTLSPKRAEKEYKVSISGPSPRSHAASKFSRSLLKVKACGFTFPSSVCQLESFTCPNPTTRNKLNPICQKCDKNTHKILSERMMRDFFLFFWDEEQHDNPYPSALVGIFYHLAWRRRKINDEGKNY